MQCSDLDRYLEAHLDNRLGRSRAMILRRHLALCTGCRARLRELRQFERTLNQQVGCRCEEPSLWQGLEPDLVRSGAGGLDLPMLALPAPTARRRPSLVPSTRQPPAAKPGSPASRRWSGLAGVLAIILALGAVLELARSWLVGSRTPGSPIEIYREFVDAGQPLALPTGDAQRLQGWLGEQLGSTFPVPPAPAGFQLTGGGRAEIEGTDAAMIVYAPLDPQHTAPTVLFVQADGPPTQPADRDGLHERSWREQPFRYRLVSADDPARLDAFVH